MKLRAETVDRISGLFRTLLGFAATMLLVATAAADEPAFRIRADFSAPLNSDKGWAGLTNESVTVFADQPFRLRIEGGQKDATTPGDLVLQARRNDGDWIMLEAHDFPYPKREVELDPNQPLDRFTSLGVDDNLPLNTTFALYEAPWPIPEFSLELGLALSGAIGAELTFLFGYEDSNNFFGLDIDRGQSVTLIQTIDGDETRLTTPLPVSIIDGYHDLEIEVENGELVVSMDERDSIIAVAIDDLPETGAFGIKLDPVAGPDGANAHVTLEKLTVQGVPKSPRASIVSSMAFNDGDRTSDLLRGSNKTFVPGLGVSLSERNLVERVTGTHSEYEFPIVIRRFADGAVLNETGDVFEFRLSTIDGVPLESATASVTLVVQDNHLGGTFVESPGRIGPWQTENGDLYFIMEPAESDNKFMIVKSGDNGNSWLEVDAANRPATGDLEAVDARLLGDRILILHQITEATYFHVYRTSDHPTHPDQWELIDEPVAIGEAISQSSAMAARSDGSIVAFFLTDQLQMTIRDALGHWSDRVALDPDLLSVNAGPQAVVDQDDVVHVAYFTADGTISYRRVLPDGSITDREVIATGAGNSEAEYGAVLPLAYDRLTDTVIIVYRLQDGSLWERNVKPDDTLTSAILITQGPVITDAVDSQQPAADLILIGSVPHVLFVDQEARNIFGAKRSDTAWQDPVLLVSEIEGSWVRGAALHNEDEGAELGFIYDAGSQGGAGMNKFETFPFEAQ